MSFRSDARAVAASREQFRQQQLEETRFEPAQQRIQELKKLKFASEAASTETAKERAFASQERKVAFERATAFISPFLEGGADGVGGTELESAQTALESTIEERGSQAQSRLSSLLAKRGVFRSGSGAAASAQLEGETEAGVAESRGRFAESAAARRQRERESQRSTALQALQSVGGFA